MQPNFCRGFPDLLSPLSISRKTGSPYACSALPPSFWRRYGGLRLSSRLVVGTGGGGRKRAFEWQRIWVFTTPCLSHLPSPYRCQRTEVLERFCHYCCLFSVTAFFLRKIYLFPKYFHFLEKFPLKNEKKYFFLSPHCISSSFDRRWPLDRPLVHQMGNNGLFARLGGKEGKWVIVCFVDEGGVHL